MDYVISIKGSRELASKTAVIVLVYFLLLYIVFA